MNEKITNWKNAIISFWTNRSKSQKMVWLGVPLLLLIIIVGAFFLATNTNFVTLYSNLSLQEANQIKTELDSRGVPYELSNGGTTIAVPEEQVDQLLVELAGQGIPNSGHIDYSFFSENTSWGITDNEFNIMKLDAMQTELANLIKGIEGINDAQVMINMPEKPLFANETLQEASASIVLKTEPGYEFHPNQINGLYHLVSKAVPNLPPENIVIMNQFFEYFDRDGTNQYAQDGHTYQQKVKRDVEKDIQQRLQQMLGAMVGMDNVIVSVTADIDFTQENREEQLVEPVDIDNMEGLPVSIETIQESYSGENAEGGVPGAGEEDIANFPGTTAGDGDGNYELDKETINYEFNRIRREIVESPYKIRDIGIQVAVDNARVNNGDIEYLSAQEQNDVEEGINSILSSIIETSVDAEYGENLNTDEKISIVFQEFSGGPGSIPDTAPVIPTWMYVVGAILLITIIVLIILLLRNRRKDDAGDEEMMEDFAPSETDEIPEIETEEATDAMVRRKQLENMAKEKPEEFAKLLRSWIGED